LTPGAWLATYGQNLAQTAHNWDDSDFSSGALPTSLGGVSVMNELEHFADRILELME